MGSRQSPSPAAFFPARAKLRWRAPFLQGQLQTSTGSAATLAHPRILLGTEPTPTRFSQPFLFRCSFLRFLVPPSFGRVCLFSSRLRRRKRIAKHVTPHVIGLCALFFGPHSQRLFAQPCCTSAWTHANPMVSHFSGPSVPAVLRQTGSPALTRGFSQCSSCALRCRNCCVLSALRSAPRRRSRAGKPVPSSAYLWYWYMLVYAPLCTRTWWL